jgi:predicted  nucleic acid-binding Zn-ribbon protein
MDWHYGDTKLDEYSQRILLKLSNSDRIASDLAESCGLDDAQQVRYRVENYLKPGDLVAEVGQKRVSGGQATVYGLTSEGEAAVEQRPADWGHIPDPEENSRRITELEDTIKQLRSELEKQESRISDRPVRATVNKDLKDALDAVDEKEDRMANWVGEARSIRNSVGGMRDEVQRIKSKVEATSHDIQSTTATADERAASAQQSVDQATDQLSAAQERISEVEGRLRRLEAWAEEKEKESILSRLWPF